MAHNSLAFFDLDYTLYKGETDQFHVILDFPYFLYENGLFQKKSLNKMRSKFSDYRMGKIERKVFADDEIRHYYEGIQGQSVKAIEESAKQWLLKSTDLLYPYAYKLVELMKNAGILTIIISGSPLEPVMLIKQELGVDDLYATKGEIDEQGIFTGKCEAEFANAEAKRQLIQTFSYNPETSFAFGDSLSDFPLLEAVNNSFLFHDNTTDSVSEDAIAKGWQVHKRDTGVLDAVKQRLDKIG